MDNLKSKLSEYFFGTNTRNKLKYLAKFNSEFDEDNARRNVQLCEKEEKMYMLIGKYAPNITSLLGVLTPIAAYANENTFESLLSGALMGMVSVIFGESLRYHIQKKEEKTISDILDEHSMNVQMFRKWNEKDSKGEEWKDGTDYAF